MGDTEGPPALRRELGLRDVTLFSIATIIGTRWIPAAAHAGPVSIVLWIASALLLMIPLSVATATLGTRHKGLGGFYRWTRNDFGAWPAFLCFWVYWLSITFWFPSAAMFYMSSGLRALGGSYAHLADSRVVVVAVSIAAIWIALGTNMAGLRVGKWTQNTGGMCSWLLCCILSAGAWLAWRRHGAATTFDLAPHFEWRMLVFWSTIAFAMSGMEITGMMTEEIRDPARTLPRAATLASIVVATFYIANTVALLVLLRPESVDELDGLAQCGEALAVKLSAQWLAPAVAALVLGSAVGQFGGTGTGISRLPLAAGVDHLLPAAFARIHPRWATPWVAILWLGCLSTVLLIAAQAGDTMRAAYQALVSLTILGGFFPYLYIFASAWKAGRRLAAATGLLTTSLALVCAVIPGEDVANVWAFEAKVAVGTGAMAGSAWLIYRRHAGRLGA